MNIRRSTRRRGLALVSGLSLASLALGVSVATAVPAVAEEGRPVAGNVAPQQDAAILPYSKIVHAVSEDEWQRGDFEIRAGKEVTDGRTSGITVNVRVSNLEHRRGLGGWFSIWTHGTDNVSLDADVVVLRDGQLVGSHRLSSFGSNVEDLSATYTFSTGGIPGHFEVAVQPVVKGIYWGGTNETFKSDLYLKTEKIELTVAE